jgi:K+ transporter
MDTTVLVPIIIAIVAVVPGIFALVNQASKGKLEERFDMLRTVQDATYNISKPLQAELTRLQARTISLEEETTTEKLYKKMYEKSVIIRCGHCKSPNVITNLECIKCGAPIGVNDA